MGHNLENMTTLELIATIEAKNHKFKIAGFIFAGCLAIGLAVLLVLGLTTLDGVNTQLTQQKKLLNSQQQILSSIKQGSDQNANNVKDLQNHIDCIVELLRQPNRASLTIKDLNGCQFDSNGNIIAPSGGSNNNGNAQKPTTAPNNNNGGATAPAPKSQSSNSLPPQTTPTPQTGVIPETVNNLFCPINLANLTCNK